jgi:DUF4097 and DUF4098 domain-containing protein YvlB
MRPYALLASTVIGLFAAGSVLAWPGDDCDFSADRRASLPAEGVVSLEIIARAGDLTVRRASGPAIEGSGPACAASAELLAKTQIRTAREGGTARLFVQVPDEPDTDRGNVTLDLTVAVPAGIAVTIVDTSGDIDVRDVRLAAITDSSGDIVVHDAEGDLEVNDSSGDVRLTNVGGAVTVTDSSGDLIVDTVQSLRVVRDSSGHIRVERVTGNVVIENDSSGDIEIDDVLGSVEVVADSTGERSIEGVKGSVSVPED